MAMPIIDLPRTYNAAEHFVDRHLDEGRADKIAFVDAAGRHTYRDLAEQVNRAARALFAQGIRREQRVMTGMLDSVEFVAVFFGAISAGRRSPTGRSRSTVPGWIEAAAVEY